MRGLGRVIGEWAFCFFRWIVVGDRGSTTEGKDGRLIHGLVSLDADFESP